jgi:hypothetical protein
MSQAAHNDDAARQVIPDCRSRCTCHVLLQIQLDCSMKSLINILIYSRRGVNNTPTSIRIFLNSYTKNVFV